MAKIQINRIVGAYNNCKTEVEAVISTAKYNKNREKDYRLEKEVEKELKKRFTADGWDCYGIQSKLGTPAGVSDLVFFKEGDVMFIEVKSPVAWGKKNHNLSDKQMKFLKQAKGYVATIINNEIIVEIVE